MPEYSSTTITPADAVKVPAQNGSTSGNFQLSALMSYILASKGQANGLAGLGADGKLDSSQIPANLDDVLVYATRSNFPATGEAGKIYISASNPENRMYRWDPDLSTPAYVELVPDLSVYATKAELAAEESAREAEDTNLKNACEQRDSALDKRVTNLEQKAGDEIVVDYPSSTYGMDGVPANVAEYAKVTKLRGVTRVHNQKVANLEATFTVSGVTFTNNADGSMTLSGTASSAISQQIFTGYIAFLANHTHLVAGLVARTGIQYGVRGFTINNASDFLFSHTANWTHCLAISIASGTNCDGITLHPIVTDLNVYFNGTIPTNAQTIAEIQQNYPELLIPSDYDTGTIVSTTHEGVKSVGVNIWDEEWEVGDYNASNGEKIPSASLMRCKNRIPIIPSETYYIKCPNVTYTYYYDANGDYLSGGVSHIANSSFTVPSNAFFMVFNTNSAYGTTYNNNIQICLNSYTDKTTYHPYMTRTLSLPSTVTGKSAGSVHQIYYPETGEMTEPINRVDLGSLNTWTRLESNQFIATLSDIAVPDGSALPNVLTLAFPRIPRTSWSTYASNNQLCICVLYDANQNPSILVCSGSSSYASADLFKTAMSGVYLDYALATPNPNSQATDPVLDPFIKVEGGGTIRPVQTQTTEIDSAMTAEYLSLGANA